MLKIQRDKIIEKWFTRGINIFDCLKLIKYNQAKYYSPLFIKDMDFYTIHIDLIQNEDSIFFKIHKNTKYEIRRGDRELKEMGGEFKKIDISQENYIKYYNEFAKSKNLSLINFKELNYYWDNLIILGITDENNQILALHAYLNDENYRARLFHSISIYRIYEKLDKNFLGRINRLLHWEAIKYFKLLNFKIYDFGGISNKKETAGIDKFKLNFSDNIVKEYHLISPLLYLLLKLRG